MDDAPDPNALEVGADASVLLAAVKGRVLAGLNEMFAVVGVPAIVKGEILRGIPAHPEDRPLVRSPSLQRVAAEDPDDLEFINDLVTARGKGPDCHDGEAELIALAARHGWIAVIEERARVIAHREGVHAVRMTTLAVAAAACGVLTEDRAWWFHRGVHRNTKNKAGLPIGTTSGDRPIFDAAVAAVRRVVVSRGDPPWPGILRDPGVAPGKLDALIEHVAGTHR